MKLEKILVATDFSQPAEAAVSQGLKMARMCEAELVLAHVGPMPSQVALDDSTPVNAQTEYQRILKAQLDIDREKLEAVRARIDGQGVEVSKVYGEGDAAEALCQLAEDIDASMIVVGTHGRTGFRRIALGSVAERVVRGATRHVLVARPALGTRRQFADIFVATDFSPASESAADLAFAIAKAPCRVELFSAWQLPMATVGIHPQVEMSSDLWAPLQGAMATATAERLESIAAAHEHDGIEVSISHAQGSPAPVIVRRLEEGDYDLLVTGAHGRRGVKRWLLGSVSERLVRLAPCSVLVARS